MESNFSLLPNSLSLALKLIWEFIRNDPVYKKLYHAKAYDKISMWLGNDRRNWFNGIPPSPKTEWLFAEQEPTMIEFLTLERFIYPVEIKNEIISNRRDNHIVVIPKVAIYWHMTAAQYYTWASIFYQTIQQMSHNGNIVPRLSVGRFLTAQLNILKSRIKDKSHINGDWVFEPFVDWLFSKECFSFATLAIDESVVSNIRKKQHPVDGDNDREKYQQNIRRKHFDQEVIQLRKFCKFIKQIRRDGSYWQLLPYSQKKTHKTRICDRLFEPAPGDTVRLSRDNNLTPNFVPDHFIIKKRETKQIPFERSTESVIVNKREFNFAPSDVQFTFKYFFEKHIINRVVAYKEKHEGVFDKEDIRNLRKVIHSELNLDHDPPNVKLVSFNETLCYPDAGVPIMQFYLYSERDSESLYVLSPNKKTKQLEVVTQIDLTSGTCSLFGTFITTS
ncbi:MAG: hypothetical protein JNL74_19745 [Fibrobacteres bacterium]|nr:hypothetical protein [Fibrobacterota bacterium]